MHNLVHGYTLLHDLHWPLKLIKSQKSELMHDVREKKYHFDPFVVSSAIYLYHHHSLPTVT